MRIKKIIAATIGIFLLVYLLQDMLFVYNISLWTAAFVQSSKPVAQQQAENMYLLIGIMARPAVIGWGCLTIGPALLTYASNEVQPFTVGKAFYIALTLALGAVYLVLLHTVMTTDLPSRGNPFQDTVLLKYILASLSAIFLGLSFPFLAKKIS